MELNRSVYNRNKIHTTPLLNASRTRPEPRSVTRIKVMPSDELVTHRVCRLYSEWFRDLLLEGSKNGFDRRAIRWIIIPASSNKVPDVVRKLGVIRSRGAVASRQRVDSPELVCASKRDMSCEKLWIGAVQRTIGRALVKIAHLPSEQPKGVDIALLGCLCSGFWGIGTHQFRSRSVRQ